MGAATNGLTWLLCVVLLAGCASVPPLPPSGSGPNDHVVSVVSDGWHAAIVVPRAQLIETGLVPETGDFPNVRFIEFGWGDRAYYPAREKTLGMALDAALRTTPAVLHLAGFNRSPEQIYGDAGVISIAMNGRRFRSLIMAIDGYFDREERDRSSSIAPGLYPHSRFYLARGGFHLFNNCNAWTTRMLRSSGVNLSPVGVVMAGQLMSQLRGKDRSSSIRTGD
ncbi:MAG: DUF2459 domain-containing protein [Pseudomonadota bacterium]